MNGDDNNMNEWRVSQAEFKGFVKATLEDINKKIGDIHGMNEAQNRRLNILENRTTKVETTAKNIGSLWGGLVGTLGAILAIAIKWLIGK